MYNSRYLNEAAVDATRDNLNIVKMFGFLGLVAMGLTATGLFTLVSLNILRRMKEIGVRKVLGASIANIAGIINRSFIIILVVSAIVGGALGKVLAEWLMANIWNYYLSPSVVTIVISAGVMFVIAIVTVGFKVFNAARMNPVNTLRDE
jgi:ABC-type antimicrobial peptide transport system permease subunit